MKLSDNTNKCESRRSSIYLRYRRPLREREKNGYLIMMTMLVIKIFSKNNKWGKREMEEY